MKIGYTGILYPDTYDYYGLNKGTFLQVSTAKFCENQIKGLEDVYGQKVKVFSLSWVPYYPDYPLSRIERGLWGADQENVEIAYRNDRKHKTLDQILGLVREIEKWISGSCNEEHILFACSITVSIIVALNIIKRRHPEIKTCLTVVDLPGRDSCEYKKGFTITNLFRNTVSFLDKKLVKRIDCFVFLTEPMASKMIKNKPFVVIEGFCSCDNQNILPSSSLEKKIIFMAGWLSYAFDIIPLVVAFTSDILKEYQLVLAGGGDAVDEIQRLSKNHKNIQYVGYLHPDEVLDFQTKATILINPRRNSHHYIKYSFPGKTFECLKSGKPYLTYKLDCIPNEYDEYMIYMDPDDENGIEKKIMEVCSWSIEKRDEFGKRAYKWVTTNKSPYVQCLKMKEMVDKL